MAVTVADVRAYLGAAADQWTDPELSSCLAAELADQAVRLRIPLVVPTPLAEALKRRVARNLAMRKIPLGIATSEIEAMRVAATDPEIRRLEAPYRKRIPG